MVGPCPDDIPDFSLGWGDRLEQLCLEGVLDVWLGGGEPE